MYVVNEKTSIIGSFGSMLINSARSLHVSTGETSKV